MHSSNVPQVPWPEQACVVLWVSFGSLAARGASLVRFMGFVRPSPPARHERCAQRRGRGFSWERVLGQVLGWRGLPPAGRGLPLAGRSRAAAFLCPAFVATLLLTFGHSATAVPAASASTMSFILPSSGALAGCPSAQREPLI